MPRETSKKVAKKAAKAQNISKIDKKKRWIKDSYARYIQHVLKRTYPHAKISKMAISVINSFLNDIFERMATEASRLAGYNKRATITSHDMHTAALLLLPGELGRCAVDQGTAALTRYNNKEEIGI